MLWLLLQPRSRRIAIITLMIKHIDISGIGYELEEDIKRYARRKIGRLDRFVPRKARPSLRAEVRLRQTNESHGNKYECEVVFHVPDEQLTAHDSTMNMFAAIDIVEEKMKNTLRRYKEKHAAIGKGNSLFRRLRRQRRTTIEPILDEV